MADFRRWFPALAVLAVVMTTLAPAYAQVGLNCVGTGAVPPLIRSEGFSELTGDVVISCTSSTSTTATTGSLPTANITVFLTAPITSRLVSSSTGTGNSEILLMVNEPLQPASGTGPNMPKPCNAATAATNGGTCPVTGADVINGTAFNVWQGTIVNTNGVGLPYVQFLGVPIEPSATPGGTTIYRITNIRADAVGLGGNLGQPQPISATLSISPTTPGATMSLANPTQVVGFAQAGLSFSVGKAALGLSSPINIQQCNGISAIPGIAAGTGQNLVPGGHLFLNFAENFATAFKVRINGQGPTLGGTLTVPVGTPPAVNTSPGTYFNSESGYYNPAVNTVLGGSSIGLADFGTRLKAVFSNIPSGVSVWVGVSNTGSTAYGATGSLAVLTSSETGAYNPVSASSGSGSVSQFAQLPVTNGSAMAVWEVISSQPSLQETFSFPVTFAATGNAGATPPTPAQGSGTVTGSFAPTPSTGGFTAAQAALPSSSLPIPRFADTGAPVALVNVNVCRTILLFPFVTNQLGFDTGMAISNTSEDPYSSVGTQAGTCTLNFFGANAPAAFVSPSAVGKGTTVGATWTTLASSVAPNFQGYVFAICNFQFAHGFAFVSDMGARNLAMGYLALIVPDRGGNVRLPDPFSTAGSATGEQLGQ